MKISDTLEPKLKHALETENERALRRMRRDRHNITIPMHTVNMRMLQSEDVKAGDSIRHTIIPDIIISIDPQTIRPEGITKYGINYILAQNKQAFPLAHVYRGGGSLCLGGIFVPSFVPKHSPQQPLETLFLHNDRHVAHGRPEILVPVEKRQQIIEIVYKLNQQFPIDVHHNDWVRRDTLWRIGEYMLDNYSREQAFNIMKDIFNILFEPNDA